jgi:hypothetical protein
VSYTTDVPVPVALGICVQRRKDDRQESSKVIAHEIDNVFVVPV